MSRSASVTSTAAASIDALACQRHSTLIRPGDPEYEEVPKI